MQDKPTHDILKIAIVAAGGTKDVAKHFNVSITRVSQWISERQMPLRHVRELTDRGGQIITTERLLNYIADHASKRHSERAASKAA